MKDQCANVPLAIQRTNLLVFVNLSASACAPLIANVGLLNLVKKEHLEQNSVQMYAAW